MMINLSRGHVLSSLHRSHVCKPFGTSARRHPSSSRTIVALGSTVTSSLISVLKDEIKYEREYYRKDESLLSSPPGDFDIDNPPGKNSFFLLKEYKNESIVIEVDLDYQPNSQTDDEGGEDDAEGEGGEDEEAAAVRFRVSVSKVGSALVFECESDGETFSINHIAYEPSSTADAKDNEDEDDSTPEYTGPVFEELDDTLQQAFLDYLEERGVTAELGGYLRLLYVDKMAEEYQAWLARVKEFVAQ